MHVVLSRVDVCSDISVFSRETFSMFNNMVLENLGEGQRDAYYKCASDCECSRCGVSCTCILSVVCPMKHGNTGRFVLLVQ